MLYICNWQQSATFWKIIVSRMQNQSCLYYAVAKYDNKSKHLYYKL